MIFVFTLPPGNENAFKHGRYTTERRALHAAIRAHIREGRALIAWAKAIDVCLGEPCVTVAEHVGLDNGVVVSQRTVRTLCRRETWSGGVAPAAPPF